MAQSIHFTLNDRPYISLCDLLKITNIVNSGGQAKICIQNGEVKRNGQIETRKRAKIIAGETIQYHQFIIQVAS